jgi:hypothetical protein
MKALLYAVRDDMVPLTPEELQEMREHIATFDMSDDDKDAIIRLVDNIVISFILSARGLDTVQLSLSARANSAFKGQTDCAKIPPYDRFKRIDLASNIETMGVPDDDIDLVNDHRSENPNPKREP